MYKRYGTPSEKSSFSGIDPREPTERKRASKVMATPYELDEME